MGGEVVSLTKLTRKDFVSGQDVRWCPGCGDYAILAVLQKVLPELGLPKENHVFVSGIGCSSRFPYYVETYGFHGIHGRAPAIATGIKACRPDLKVWVVTGDGDALSIGGNHFMHALRRNIGIVMILFNNRIYGLTKGQYSPTSEFGKKTKTSPYGTVDYPIRPISLALGAEATFVARAFDSDTQGLGTILHRAARHKGSAFVEIYQNCVIFNDNAFADVTDRQKRADTTLILEQGKPLIFGKDRDRGIRLNGTFAEVVRLGKDVTEDELLVHDETSANAVYPFLLSRMELPEFPVPFGVFRDIERPAYEAMIEDQIQAAREASGPGDIQALLKGAETWRIEL